MNIEWMQHQLRAIEHMRDRKFTPLFMEAGTGKTPVALWKMEEWLDAKIVKRILVVAPNTVTSTWIAEAEKWGFKYPIRKFTPGGFQSRYKQIIEEDWTVFVVNYESLIAGQKKNAEGKIIHYGLLSDVARLKSPEAYIFDEIQKLKNRRAYATKYARAGVVKSGKLVLGLTGTPLTESPLDLWSQFDVMSPWDKKNHPLGYGSFSSFEKQVTNVSYLPGRKYKIYTHDQAKLSELEKRVNKHAFTAVLDKCVDMPSRTWIQRYPEMDGDQLTAYKTMKAESIAMLKNGELVTQQHILGQILKLQQIAAGFIIKEDKEIFRFNDNAKLEAFSQLLEESLIADHKTVVFVRYTADIHILSEYLEKEKIGYVALHGQTSKDAGILVKAFQDDRHIRVFLSQIQTGNLGITLTKGSNVIYYTNSFSLEHRIQSERRIWRIGQELPVIYYDLLIRGSIDEHIFTTLQKKRDLTTYTAPELAEVLRSA